MSYIVIFMRKYVYWHLDQIMRENINIWKCYSLKILIFDSSDPQSKGCFQLFDEMIWMKESKQTQLKIWVLRNSEQTRRKQRHSNLQTAGIKPIVDECSLNVELLRKNQKSFVTPRIAWPRENYLNIIKIYYKVMIICLSNMNLCKWITSKKYFT